VDWQPAEAALICPCHGAVFDPQDGGVATAGPAQDPLASIPIVVDPATRRILLRT
jgi:thiosulfate dehydrogenase [quinone] large subunit